MLISLIPPNVRFTIILYVTLPILVNAICKSHPYFRDVKMCVLWGDIIGKMEYLSRNLKEEKESGKR